MSKLMRQLDSANKTAYLKSFHFSQMTISCIKRKWESPRSSRHYLQKRNKGFCDFWWLRIIFMRSKMKNYAFYYWLHCLREVFRRLDSSCNRLLIWRFPMSGVAEICKLYWKSRKIRRFWRFSLKLINNLSLFRKSK